MIAVVSAAFNSRSYTLRRTAERSSVPNRSSIKLIRPGWLPPTSISILASRRASFQHFALEVVIGYTHHERVLGGFSGVFGAKCHWEKAPSF